MKLSTRDPRRNERGILLIEVMTHIAVFTLISAVATAAFFKYWDAATRLERATDDIVRALQAGEIWRADIRRVIHAPVLVREGGEEALELEMKEGKVIYLFSRDGVWRQSDPSQPWVRLVPRAQGSRMFADDRGGIAAWRWELELARPKESPGKLLPRFTFVAVPSQPTHP